VILIRLRLRRLQRADEHLRLPCHHHLHRQPPGPNTADQVHTVTAPTFLMRHEQLPDDQLQAAPLSSTTEAHPLRRGLDGPGVHLARHRAAPRLRMISAACRTVRDARRQSGMAPAPTDHRAGSGAGSAASP
jgi:hypothetical protein